VAVFYSSRTFSCTGYCSPVFEMLSFSEYVTEEHIILFLCRTRAKIAKARGRKHLVHRLTTNPEFNYHKGIQRSANDDLNNLLPSRRKWKKLGEERRRPGGKPLNSIERNVRSIQLTIRFYKKNFPSEPFLLRLAEFVDEVKASCSDPSYRFSFPRIVPKAKEGLKDGRTVCRPICDFSLKDKVIIGLTNKYWTELFDPFMSDSSYAFRSARPSPNGKTAVTHHDAFGRLADYREQHRGRILYVAECDMKKFYDTVNHTMIKRAFRRFVGFVEKAREEKCDPAAVNLFHRFLDSYTFVKQVLVLNGNDAYFKRSHIVHGCFEWPEKELVSNGYYKNPRAAKIGVPQGGALSGLVANMVLDYVDRKVEASGAGDLLYVRYCDDMVIAHPDEKVCSLAFSSYLGALKRLKLVPHDPAPNADYGPEFWHGKSKLPYRWGNGEGRIVPWVGFVGYEINYEGDIRVRKSSISKELQKQREVVEEVLKAIEGGTYRARKGKIEESVVNRLIGMSVGRMALWNYRSVENDLCWIKGFRLLNDNRFSRVQLKRLDRNRNQLLARLRSVLSELPERIAKGEVGGRHRQSVFYGKPFSYYYQMLEKERPQKEPDADNVSTDV